MAEPMPPADHDTSDRSTGASSYESTSTRDSGGISGGRHLTSVLLALLLVPAGLLLVDYTFYRALNETGIAPEEGRLATEVIVTMCVAAACFLAAAATGRISALGPLVAGLVWGAAPMVWLMLDFASYSARIIDLPNPYDGFGVVLRQAGFAILPAVTGMLLGTAVAGRWRGSR